MRFLASLALAALFRLASQAQDALPAEKLTLIKRATVLVKTENSEEACTGSGFLIRIDGTTGYLATNNHVIDLSHGHRGRNAPRTESVEVVFDSGQIGERVVKAEVLAADVDRDLAILRVKGVAALPAPIPLDDAPKLTETMPVLACGFPFGGSLATSRKHAAVTISNSRVSSVRLDDAGQVSVVQLDGSALNPGNSGGPIVTMDGKLVGVAVAGIPGSGIGFAVPNQELHKLVKGRAGKPAVFATPADATTIQLRVEGPLLDPYGAIKGVSVYHRASASGERPPAPDAKGLWPALAATPLEASIKDGWATATLRVPRGKAAGIWVQFEYRTAAGVVRDEPLELRIPTFPAGNFEGRYLTGVRNDAVEPRAVGPKGQIALKDLNRQPDRFLGQVVTIDGVITGSSETGGKAVLAVGFDKSAKPTNLKFLGHKSLNEQIQDAAKGSKPVRIVGSVMAPQTANAPYTIEVDEVNVLADDGSVSASYKPTSTVSEKPTPPVSEPVAAKAEEPAKDAAAESPNLATFVAGGAAILVGCLAGGFVLLKRRGTAKAAPPPPTLSVSERLNRRVR